MIQPKPQISMTLMPTIGERNLLTTAVWGLLWTVQDAKLLK